jgi:hypothetical protein
MIYTKFLPYIAHLSDIKRIIFRRGVAQLILSRFSASPGLCSISCSLGFCEATCLLNSSRRLYIVPATAGSCLPLTTIPRMLKSIFTIGALLPFASAFAIERQASPGAVSFPLFRRESAGPPQGGLTRRNKLLRRQTANTDALTLTNFQDVLYYVNCTIRTSALTSGD